MSSTAGEALDQKAWWQHLNKYHWYVFVLAALGWLFDTMDQQIFTASRSLTMASLMPNDSEGVQRQYGGYVTMLFIIGWATGGLIFGVIGDRWGRAKTMALTIFIYAAFTGLSAVCRNWWEFGICRFLTGLGVGGEFAAGTALVAEVMPVKARAQALGMLQALSAVGNIIGAALLGIVVPRWGWEGLYWIGALPALLAVFVRVGMKEPDTWIAAKEAAKNAPPSERKEMGAFTHLFTVPRWRHNTLVGLSLAIAGVVGLWGVGFYSPELIDASIMEASVEMKPKLAAIAAADTEAQKPLLAALSDKEKEAYKKAVLFAVPGFNEKQIAEPLTPDQQKRVAARLEKSMTKDEKTKLKSRALMLQQVGAFFGMIFFGMIAARMGRRPAFLVAFILAWGAVAYTFYSFNSPEQIYYMYPILGFGTLAPFAGYALYFPELYPTRLRTTGISFCYNVGRYAAAFIPPVFAFLANNLHGKFETPGFRLAAIIVASSYAMGMLTLLWAPETKGQPLPEEEGQPAPKEGEVVVAH